MVDPITDMFNRIKNAQAVSHEAVVIPFSRLKFEIALILEKEGLIDKAQKKGKKTNKLIEINLRYGEEGGAIEKIKRISKPGQRIYLPVEKIKKVKDGYGISIISTSKGLMTDKEARKKRLGGEIICEVW